MPLACMALQFFCPTATILPIMITTCTVLTHTPCVTALGTSTRHAGLSWCGLPLPSCNCSVFALEPVAAGPKASGTNLFRGLLAFQRSTCASEKCHHRGSKPNLAAMVQANPCTMLVLAVLSAIVVCCASLVAPRDKPSLNPWPSPTGPSGTMRVSRACPAKG